MSLRAEPQSGEWAGMGCRKSVGPDWVQVFGPGGGRPPQFLTQGYVKTPCSGWEGGSWPPRSMFARLSLLPLRRPLCYHSVLGGSGRSWPGRVIGNQLQIANCPNRSRRSPLSGQNFFEWLGELGSSCLGIHAWGDSRLLGVLTTEVTEDAEMVRCAWATGWASGDG
jgi:hypothetical protein